MDFGAPKRGRSSDASAVTQARRIQAANIGAPVTRKQGANTSTFASGTLYAQAAPVALQLLYTTAASPAYSPPVVAVVDPSAGGMESKDISGNQIVQGGEFPSGGGGGTRPTMPT